MTEPKVIDYVPADQPPEPDRCDACVGLVVIYSLGWAVFLVDQVYNNGFQGLLNWLLWWCIVHLFIGMAVVAAEAKAKP